MDSRQRFVLAYGIVAMVPFIAFTFLNVTDLGVYASGYAVGYFALRLIMNPKMRLKVDVLGLLLLALFVYFVAVRIGSMQGVQIP